MKKTLLLGVACLIMSVSNAQVDCNISNIQGGFAGGYLNWVLDESGIFAFIDPGDDYTLGEGCGATYPYTIENVTFTLADGSVFTEGGDGIGTFSYELNVYEMVDGDPCNGPGALIGGSGEIIVELDGAGFNAQDIDLNIDVFDAFFISYEPISWTGELDEVPSILWDAEDRPLCQQFFTSDGGTTYEDHTDFITDGETGWADFNIFGSSESGSGGACEAGTIDDTTALVLCPDESGTFSVTGQEVPVGGGYALTFVPSATGTGALADTFNLTGISLPYSFDSDLNGVLSANSFPMFEGEWYIFGIVYENPDSVANTVCSITEDFISVTFLSEDDPECAPGDECTDWVNPTSTTGWGDFNIEFGGAPCNDGDGCPFNEITGFEVWQSEAYILDNVQIGGSYTFSHCNGDGAGSWIPEYTIIAPSGAIDASGAGDGDGCSITWIATEEGTYFIVVNEAGACGVEGTDDNGFPAITCNGTPLCEPQGEECTDWVNPSPTTGWSDFNTEFGGAPCNDGDGCPFNEITAFEVWQSEAYALDDVQIGGSYTFSHCNGDGAGSWIPEYTIIAPSGAIDAFGAGDGDGCSITWTATEEGTYFIVINEAGACGVEGTDDNGFPAITCNETPDCGPTTDWCDEAVEGPWTNFNSEFDGAPTPDSEGNCETFEITGFEVWASEAYLMDNITTGVEYTFSHCNGDGAGSWVPEYTIYAPSGAVDAYGPGNADGCSISWVATETGTYTIAINEAGACGITNIIDNGFPAITCNGNVSVEETAALDFSVFPNPNNGQFVIDFSGESGMAQIDVLTVSGKTVVSEQRMLNSNTQLDIDLGNDVSGMYFVLITMNQNSTVLKIIVN